MGFELKITPYNDSFLNAYINFAKKNWGECSHQSSPNFIKWLYLENPSAIKSETDLLLAVLDEKEVIGCIHKMRLSWKVNNLLLRIPSIHDLMVTPEYRQGIGLDLAFTAFKAEEHAFVPGTKSPAGKILHEKVFKSQKINSSWYRKVLSPIKIMISVSLNKLKGLANSLVINNINCIINLAQNTNFIITSSPSINIITKLCDSLNNYNNCQAYPFWTPDQFKWRFFHPIGPKHILIYKDSATSIEDMVILSIGYRNGLIVGRIIELHCSSLVNLNNMLKLSNNFIKKAGAHILLIYSSNTILNDMLNKLNYKTIKDQPNTYFYHKNRNNIFESYAFNSSVGDFGFESMLTNIEEK